MTCSRDLATDFRQMNRLKKAVKFTWEFGLTLTVERNGRPLLAVSEDKQPKQIQFRFWTESSPSPREDFGTANSSKRPITDVEMQHRNSVAVFWLVIQFSIFFDAAYKLG